MTAHGEHKVGSDAAMAAAILLLGGFLWITGLPFADRWILSGAGRRAPDFDQLLGAATTAAGSAIAAWWVLSMLSALLAAVLERAGRKRAAATAGKLCPAFMRRLALAVLSVQLVSAPLAHAETPSGPVWFPAQGAAAPAAWEPTGGGTAVAFLAAPSSAPEEQGSLSELPPELAAHCPGAGSWSHCCQALTGRASATTIADRGHGSCRRHALGHCGPGTGARGLGCRGGTALASLVPGQQGRNWRKP